MYTSTEISALKSTYIKSENKIAIFYYKLKLKERKNLNPRQYN